MNNNSLWSFLKKYYLPVKYRFMAIFILVPIVALCGQLAPWYVSDIVNILNTGDISDLAWQNLINTFIFLGIVLVGGNILMMLTMYIMQHKLISPLGIKVRKDLFVGVVDDMVCCRHFGGEPFASVYKWRFRGTQSTFFRIYPYLQEPPCVFYLSGGSQGAAQCTAGYQQAFANVAGV